MLERAVSPLGLAQRRYATTGMTLLLTVVLLMCSSVLRAGQIVGKVTTVGMPTHVDALVFIEKIEGQSFKPPRQPVVMDQKGMEFVPRVLPLLLGTTVAFRNSDSFFHNVFSIDDCDSEFSLGTFGPGEYRMKTFDKRCVSVILCTVHANMEAYIVTVETPYFALTDAEGNYSIPDVPDGAYTLSVWHRTLEKSRSQPVKVQGETRVELTLK
jgi:plastocyanin